MKNKVELIKEKMETLGITNYRLSKGSGIAQSTIGRVLSGESNPNPQTVSKLCAYLGIEDASVVTITKEDAIAMQKEIYALRERVEYLDQLNALLVRNFGQRKASTVESGRSRTYQH